MADARERTISVSPWAVRDYTVTTQEGSSIPVWAYRIVVDREGNLLVFDRPFQRRPARRWSVGYWRSVTR